MQNEDDHELEIIEKELSKINNPSDEILFESFPLRISEKKMKKKSALEYKK